MELLAKHHSQITTLLENDTKSKLKTIDVGSGCTNDGARSEYYDHSRSKDLHPIQKAPGQKS
jgi:hypothetical protein